MSQNVEPIVDEMRQAERVGVRALLVATAAEPEVLPWDPRELAKVVMLEPEARQPLDPLAGFRHDPHPGIEPPDELGQDLVEVGSGGNEHCFLGAGVQEGRVGATIALDVATWHPASSRYIHYPSMGGFIAAFVLGMSALGLVFLLAGALSRASRRKLYARGLPALADIVEVQERRSGGPKIVVRYAFEAAGKRYTGSFEHGDADLVRSLVAGPRVVVLHDAKDPHANLLWVR